VIPDPFDCSALFRSDAMQKVLRIVERIAPTGVAVLLTGESGTGKELIADLIHIRSGRPRPNIAKVSCSALDPDQLADFGAEARGGTLFLRDICELPARTQGTLLDLLDKGEGPPAAEAGAAPAPRIVAATNRDPEEAVKQGALQAELYYRISTITLHLPPLRERREDIMPLAHALLKRALVRTRRDIKGFAPAAAELLARFDWPGNMTQLQNEIQRAVLFSGGDTVDAFHLSISSSATAKPPADDPVDTSFTILEDVERDTIIRVLRATGGNKLETAKRLGIGRQTLYNKIKIYGIEV
jgi:two-component system, NtrC family, response regulator HydG